VGAPIGGKPPLSASEGRPGTFSLSNVTQPPREITRARVRNWVMFAAVVLFVGAAAAYPRLLPFAGFLVAGVVATGVAVWLHRTQSARADWSPDT